MHSMTSIVPALQPERAPRRLSPRARRRAVPMRARGRTLFHLAFPVGDLEQARRYYVDGLGCTLGRRSGSALTLGLAGHQLVAHLSERPPEVQAGIYPRHFGLVFLARGDWLALAARVRAQGLRFYQAPHRRFAGLPIEHDTFFLEDPFHNLLEFKHYRRRSAILDERDLALLGDAGEEEREL